MPKHYHVWLLSASRRAFFRYAKCYRTKQAAHKSRLPHLSQLVDGRRTRLVLACDEDCPQRLCIEDTCTGWMNRVEPGLRRCDTCGAEVEEPIIPRKDRR